MSAQVGSQDERSSGESRHTADEADLRSHGIGARLAAMLDRPGGEAAAGDGAPGVVDGSLDPDGFCSSYDPDAVAR